MRDPDEKRKRRLSDHILPASGTMIGVCTTLIGLVKVVEGRNGRGHVDELAALTSLVFLVGAITSYASIRWERRETMSRRLETIADQCFLFGLCSIVAISVFFAYEII